MKLIKFRIYDPVKKKMLESGGTPTMLASFFRNTAVLNVRDGMEYQQFIGLLDKAGKEIYEGDILKSGIKPWIVEKITACFMMVQEQPTRLITKIERFIHEEVEIIGSIYENPELLDG